MNQTLDTAQLPKPPMFLHRKRTEVPIAAAGQGLTGKHRFTEGKKKLGRWHGLSLAFAGVDMSPKMTELTRGWGAGMKRRPNE